jgi:hypothetical protein
MDINEVRLRAQDLDSTSPPSAVPGLTARRVQSTGQLLLEMSWAAATGGDSYVLYRAMEPLSSGELVSISPPVRDTSREVVGFSGQRLVFYTVRAISACGIEGP